MSRMTRLEHQARYHRLERPKRLTQADIEKKLNSYFRQKAIDQGYLAVGPKIYEWRYELPDGTVGIVEATSRSEAKSRCKSVLGIPKRKRLPADVQLTQLELVDKRPRAAPKAKINRRRSHAGQ